MNNFCILGCLQTTPSTHDFVSIAMTWIPMMTLCASYMWQAWAQGHNSYPYILDWLWQVWLLGPYCLCHWEQFLIKFVVVVFEPLISFWDTSVIFFLALSCFCTMYSVLASRFQAVDNGSHVPIVAMAKVEDFGLSSTGRRGISDALLGKWIVRGNFFHSIVLALDWRKQKWNIAKWQ